MGQARSGLSHFYKENLKILNMKIIKLRFLILIWIKNNLKLFHIFHMIHWSFAQEQIIIALGEMASMNKKIFKKDS